MIAPGVFKWLTPVLVSPRKQVSQVRILTETGNIILPRSAELHRMPGGAL